jgi:uncharacterized protein (DUF983 family)
MKKPICPNCGHIALGAFLKPKFKCVHCSAQLSSDLQLIGFIESLVFIIPVYFFMGLIKKQEWSGGIVGAIVGLIFFTFSLLTHCWVVCNFVTIKIDAT